MDDEEGYVVGSGVADGKISDFIDYNLGKIGGGILGVLAHQVFQTFVAEHLMLFIEGFGDADAVFGVKNGDLISVSF